MEGKRQYLLDGLRGLTLISMILYHGMFDLLEIYGGTCELVLEITGNYMAAEYLLELYYPVGVLLEFKPESCEERTGGVSRRSVGKCGNLDLYAEGTNYIWNSDISGKCYAPAGVVEAVA